MDENNTDKIKIIIADDMPEICDYFKNIFERERDMEVVSCCHTGKEAVLAAEACKPDVVLMDVEMETPRAGIEALNTIKTMDSSIYVIMLTIYQTDEILFDAFGNQADDFIVKTSSVADVLNSIRKVYNHRLSLKPEWTQKILEQFSKMYSERASLLYTLNLASKLTPSEMDILQDIYHGNTYKKIAKKRCVEEVTIRTQVNRILKKFECDSMKKLVKMLKDMRFFDIYKQ